MTVMNHEPNRTALGTRLALAVAGVSLLLGTTLGCVSGTPAAPDGTEIPVSYEYITRNTTSGDFEAIINAIRPEGVTITVDLFGRTSDMLVSPDAMESV